MTHREQYALIPLRDMVIFPNMITPVFIGREKSKNALKIADETDKKIFFTLQKKSDVNDPEEEDLFTTGTVAKLLQVLKLPDGNIKILVEGVRRAKIDKYHDDGESAFADVNIIDDKISCEENAKALHLTLLNSFEEYISQSGKLDSSIIESLSGVDDLHRLSFMIASNLPVRNEALQDILEIDGTCERVEKLIETIETEIELIKLDNKIKAQVKSQMSKAQKEYYLGEQVKAINKELGKDDDYKEDIEEIEKKITELPLPEAVRTKAEKEFKKFKLMPPMSAETTVSRNYLDWLLSLPWGNFTEDSHDINEAQKILDRDHFGLDKPKERILEFLAVKSLSERIKGPILCLVGPPGVGKTSLARSIAKSMNKEFVRMSLGGVRDEAEVRGHRRTYIGSLPGKIIQSIKKAESMNPVFLLDEIDKLGADYRGDPSSALLEALDPEQNSTFMDHYLEVEFDLSKVFFVTTANSVDTIPGPLLDRMEVIRIAGYTEMEKFHIAKNFLIKKQLDEHNLDDERVKIADSAVMSIIRYYTKEAGVRNLERELASVIRKAAKKLVTKKNMKCARINDKNIESYLGIKKYKFEEIFDEEEIGAATGLAWTPYGGDTLQIEVAVYQGTGKLLITGKLGDVMQESAKTALSLVKTRATEYGIPAYRFKDFDIHIHVPEGAVPKDGPSAGVTLASAMLSAFSQQAVKCRTAMTGEITLRGRVLPVGGIKEKVLAAHRIGIRDIIIPEGNRKDLTDVPSDVKNEIRFVYASSIDDVFDAVIIKKGSD